MENTEIEKTEDVIADITEETLLSLDETLELDQEQTEIAEGKMKKEEEEDMTSTDDDEEMTEGSLDNMSLEQLWDKHEEYSYTSDQGYGIGQGSSKNAEAAAEAIFKFVKSKFGAKVADDMQDASQAYVSHQEYDNTSESKNKRKAIRKKHGLNEAKMTEAEVSSDEEFTEYAQGVLKAAHGDKYDEKKAMETVEGILKKADGDYGAAVGMLTSGLGEEMEDEKPMKEDSEIVIDSSDITRLVESEDGLTEEFKEKATIIFEAAVKSKIKETEEALKESYAVTLIEEVEAIKEDLTEKIDNYLTYAVESWVEDNKVAIEGGLRTQIAESFIQSLKNVFVENYIEVPESKTDLVAEMESTIAKLQEEKEEVESSVTALSEEVSALTREKVIAEATANLADTQAEKLKTLVEDIRFSSETSFRKKVETIKEFYLNGIMNDSKMINEDIEEDENSSYVTTETIVENEELEDNVSPAMKNYLTALSRLNKATTANVSIG